MSKEEIKITENAPKITLRIEKLWGEENVFEWELNPDVNILSGINGSGKSTILRILEAVLKNEYGKLRTARTARGQYKVEEFVNAEITINEKKYLIKSNYRISDTEEPNQVQNVYQVDYFASLDKEAISKEDIQSVSNHNPLIKSEIDFEIYQKSIKYTKYLLSISQRIEKAYANGAKNIAEKLAEIYAKKTLFFDIIDELFECSDKKIDRESNELTFLKSENKMPLLVYLLSSGEKQMLLILLNVLLQDNQPSVYILDEPEISLHPDWQEKLIGNIRNLNKNCVVVIATHSPDIIVNGWLDKEFLMEDLLKPLSKTKNEANG